MKTTTEKLTNCYSVNLDEESAQMIEAIAREQQRKPRELLRLLLKPIIKAEWIKLQTEQHPENNNAPTVAQFKL